MKLIKIDNDNYVNPEAIAALRVHDWFSLEKHITGHQIEIITVNDDYFIFEIFKCDDRSLTKYDTQMAARQRLDEIAAKLNAEEISC